MEPPLPRSISIFTVPLSRVRRSSARFVAGLVSGLDEFGFVTRAFVSASTFVPNTFSTTMDHLTNHSVIEIWEQPFFMTESGRRSLGTSRGNGRHADHRCLQNAWGIPENSCGAC